MRRGSLYRPDFTFSSVPQVTRRTCQDITARGDIDQFIKNAENDLKNKNSLLYNFTKNFAESLYSNRPGLHKDIISLESIMISYTMLCVEDSYDLGCITKEGLPIVTKKTRNALEDAMFHKDIVEQMRTDFKKKVFFRDKEFGELIKNVIKTKKIGSVVDKALYCVSFMYFVLQEQGMKDIFEEKNYAKL